MVKRKGLAQAFKDLPRIAAARPGGVVADTEDRQFCRVVETVRQRMAEFPSSRQQGEKRVLRRATIRPTRQPWSPRWPTRRLSTVLTKETDKLYKLGQVFGRIR